MTGPPWFQERMEKLVLAFGLTYEQTLKIWMDGYEEGVRAGSSSK